MIVRTTMKSTWVFATAMVICGPALAQQKPASENKAASTQVADVKQVVDDDAAAVQPNTTQPKGDPGSTEQPVRRIRSSVNMQSAPKASADDVLRQFEQDRPKARPLLPGRGNRERTVHEPLTDGDLRRSPARLPEGYFLVDRAGRLTREGPWFVFNFIGDNNPTATPDPPMRLLPNRMLERMIRESKGSTVSVEFIVSGEVTDFMGENHLLLRKLLRKRSVGNLSN